MMRVLASGGVAESARLNNQVGGKGENKGG